MEAKTIEGWWQHYRGWRIRREGMTFVAEEPAYDFARCRLVSRSLCRIRGAIDLVERSHAGVSAPIWYLFALSHPLSGSVDLDMLDKPPQSEPAGPRPPRL